MAAHSDTARQVAECDNEPIHIPGSVQPHGVLLAVDPGTGKVVQAAGAEHILGRLVDQALGKTLADILGSAAASAVQAAIRGQLREPTYAASVRPAGGEPLLDVMVHKSSDLDVVEIEPAADSAAECSGNLIRNSPDRGKPSQR